MAKTTHGGADSSYTINGSLAGLVRYYRNIHWSSPCVAYPSFNTMRAVRIIIIITRPGAYGISSATNSPNQPLEPTGLSFSVWPWDCSLLIVSSPVAQLVRSAWHTYALGRPRVKSRCA